MHQVRVLTIMFEPEIRGREIPAFRGAIIAKVGKDCVLFHNHQDAGYRYKYPLIQYKRINHHASIVCIQEGIDEIYRLFNQPDWKIRIGKQEKELKIIKLKIEKYNLQVWEKLFTFKIFNWLALNEKNYQQFRNLETDAQRLEMLEKILTGNILSFAKGIGWFLTDKLTVKIQKIERQKLTIFKGNKLTAFDLIFSTNVYLPPYIGLGKAVSHGYGKIIPYRHKPENQDKTTQQNENNSETD